MDDIVQHFIECLLNNKSKEVIGLNYTKNKAQSSTNYSKSSFNKKYLIKQNINYYLNKKFNNNKLNLNFKKFKKTNNYL